MATKEPRTRLRAQLYLGDIAQERIKPSRIKGVPVGEYFKTGDAAIVICCDGFCCILDCERPTHPGDVVINPAPEKRWSPELVLRREAFGGLVWNRKTGHVWQLDKKTTRVCFELARGKTLKEVAAKYDVTESDLFAVLADVSQQL